MRICLGLGLVAVTLSIVPAAAHAAGSGSNGRIFFTSDRDGFSNDEVYSANADGSDLVRLTNRPVADELPMVSPAGSRIAFETLLDGSRPTLHVMDADGAHEAALTTETSGADTYPSWSPDGQTIVFSSSRPDDAAYRLWTVKADGSGLTQLTTFWATQPAWSPDGTKIAFIGMDTSAGNPRDGLAVMNSDGTGAHFLTLGASQSESRPAWSPDGTRLVFGRYTNFPDDNAHELYIINADGSGEHAITSGGYMNFDAAWSPDGTKIVFQRRLGVFDDFELYTMNIDGSGLAPFMTSPGENLLPDWAVLTVDQTPPTVSITTPPDGAVYAWGQFVAASYSCTDEAHGSGLASCVGPVHPGSAINTSSIGAKSFTVVARDNAGNTTSVTHNYMVVDRTPPAISIYTPAAGAGYLLGDVVSADYLCADGAGASGVANCDGTVAEGQPIDTSSVGMKTFVVNASDVAGNTRTASASYWVVYHFTGFMSPVDNLPVVNPANPGQAIGLKFSLDGNQGLNVFVAGSPSSVQVPCDSSTPVPADEPTTGSLSYNAQADRYTYTWSTQKSWVGTCRQIVFKLRDGSEHRAMFRFSK